MSFAPASELALAEFETDKPHALVPPPVFKYFVIACLLGGLATIGLTVIFWSDDSSMFNFKESGLVTVLSSAALSMASVLSLLVFYLKSSKWQIGNLFWLGLSAGLFFLALDEHLQFHEKVGWLVSTTSVGKPELFRNWNDLIVILYGVIALIGFAMFGREIVKCRTFAIYLAVGFLFYVIHTAVDSTVSSTMWWKDIPEEGAKLFAVIFMFLAVSGQILSMIAQLTDRASRRQ